MIGTPGRARTRLAQAVLHGGRGRIAGAAARQPSSRLLDHHLLELPSCLPARRSGGTSPLRRPACATKTRAASTASSVSVAEMLTISCSLAALWDRSAEAFGAWPECSPSSQQMILPGAIVQGSGRRGQVGGQSDKGEGRPIALGDGRHLNIFLGRMGVPASRDSDTDGRQPQAERPAGIGGARLECQREIGNAERRLLGSLHQGMSGR